jgi:hypothetical protein
MPVRPPEIPAPRYRQRERGGCIEGVFEFVGEGCAEVLFEVPLVIVAIAALLLAAFVVVPLILAVVDIVVVLVLAGAGIVGRVLFHRPWTIEATSSDGEQLTWQVVGWRASGDRRDVIAAALDAGVVPPPDAP